MSTFDKCAVPGSLPEENPDNSTQAADKAAFRPLRLVLYPNGAALELTRPDMVVGRHSHADLRLHLPDVSRRHCRFLFADGHWHVHDLQSTNGVFVNEVRVNRAELRPRDLIRIGSYTFEVQMTGEEQHVAPLASDERNRQDTTADGARESAPSSQRRAS
jgi:pSer/pThr/pTyr-binding forkhead associated (FHA) protein